ncbi:MAG: diguanylate cyclase [Thalassovita sp.]
MPGKVLVIDGISTNRIVLRVKLSSAFFTVLQASNGTEALAMLAHEKPDLIMVSAVLPDMTGEMFCKRVKRVDGGRDRPVVLTLPESNRDALISGLRAGADEVMCHPFSDELLYARLRALIRSRNSLDDLGLSETHDPGYGLAEPMTPYLPPLRIGLVTTQVAKGVLWRQAMNLHPRHQLVTYTPRNLMQEFALTGVPDILVLHLPAGTKDNGLTLLAGLHAQPDLRRTQFMVVLDEHSNYLAADALDLGANDLLFNGFDAQEATLRLSKLARNKHLADRLHHSVRDGLRAAMTDALTGLHNRRFAMPELTNLLTQSQVSKRPVAVLMADIDHFKQINDSFGHAIGDAVLRQIASRMSAMMRPQDLLARIGGEEFLIALPGLSVDQARLAAKRLCSAIGTRPLTVAGLPDPITTTISIGLALTPCPKTHAHVTAAELMKQADTALYSSKAEGRNQVSLCQPAA